MEELLSLKWNNHRSTFLHILTILRNKQLYTDATLACEGRFYSVHKLVLSTCSDYFSAMFDRTTCKNPIIVLKDIKCEDLEALLDYMYLGEVNVRQADLASLIKAAECLRVKGLAVPDDEPPKKGSHGDSSSRRPDGVNSPPAKRKRKNEDQDGRDDVRPGGVRASPSLSSRPKSPHSHSRLSPLLDSESGRSSPHLSDGNQNSVTQLSEEGQQIKVEREDNSGSVLEDNYDLANDTFKEEPNTDPGGELSNDLPEFLQQASGSSYTHSYPGPSFQPDLQNWQGDQVLGANYSGMGFGPTPSQDGSQNASASGASEEFTEVKHSPDDLICVGEDTPDTSADASDKNDAAVASGTTSSKPSSSTKYKVTYKGKPRKSRGKISPLVLSKVVPEKKESLSDYIAVSELGKSIASIMGGLNLKLMEELLQMGFPCAICKGNEIFSNLEEHLITNHTMSTRVAEDYVGILMNKMSEMITDLKDQSQSIHSQETTSRNQPSTSEKKVSHSLTIDNLPLADHIFIMKYQMFLESEFPHHSALTSRVYKRKASEMICFFRQNGIAFSECPIKSAEDISTIASVLWKFCTARSVCSPTTLNQTVYYFSFFMNHFYKQFYDTDPELLKILKSHFSRIRIQLKQKKNVTSIKRSKAIRNGTKTPKDLTVKSSSLAPRVGNRSKEQGISLKSKTAPLKAIKSTQGEASTSGIQRKKASFLIKRRNPDKKRALKLTTKGKEMAELFIKATNAKGSTMSTGSLISNPIYRKCLALLAHESPSSTNACRTRNAVIFTILHKLRLSKKALCGMTLGDFRNAQWCSGKRAFLVTLVNSPTDDPLYFKNNIVRHISNWITKYRGFFSSDDSNDAPAFVTDNGSQLNTQLLHTINYTFSKLCAFNFNSSCQTKGVKRSYKKAHVKGGSPLPVVDEGDAKQQGIKPAPEKEKSTRNIHFGEGSAKKTEALSSSVFYPQPKRKSAIKIENNKDHTSG